MAGSEREFGAPSRGRAALVAAALVVAACSRSRERAPPRPIAYVSDEEGGYVVVVDTDKNVVKTRIAVGKRPRGLKISHDGRRLFVALSGSPRMGPLADARHVAPPDRRADGIGIVDLETNTLVRTLKSGQDPESFDLSADDATLYVSNEETAEMSVLDVSSGAVKAKVPVGNEPEGVAIRPDGKVVFIASEQDGAVTAVDTKTLAVVARVPTGARPRSIVFTSDGRLGFVTSEGGPGVTLIDPNRFVALGTIVVHEDSPMPSGPRPMGAALSRDERQLYVSTGRGGSVAVIDVAARKQVRSIDGVGDRPWGIALSPDGRHLYTANGTSNDLSLVDPATGNVDKRIPVRGLPWGVVD